MKNAASCLLDRGHGAALLQLLLHGQTMQSVLQILLVNVKDGVSKKTGNAFSIKEAHCVLQKDDGTPSAVGVLTIPKNLEEHAKPGTYLAAFTLEAPTYGPDAGKVIAQLAGLTSVDPAQLSRRAASIAAAGVAAAAKS
jgi:hypothetical protein